MRISPLTGIKEDLDSLTEAINELSARISQVEAITPCAECPQRARVDP